MKIKYLKQAPQGMPGDIAEVPDLQANILIKLKFAEPVDGEPQIEFLKNLNGTPVIDDFGSLVTIQNDSSNLDDAIKEQSQKTEPSKTKPTRARKAK
jgi:hypothetical protein